MAISYSLVTDRKSVRGLRQIWRTHYGDGEIEPERETLDSVKNGWCRIVVAKDGDEVVGGTEFGVDVEGGTAFGMFGYMDVAETHRRQGIAATLGRMAIEQMGRDAKEKGMELSVLTAEATSDSEVYWNSLGFRRLYVKEFTTYIEVQYIQPSLDFDKNGLPTKAEAPEHLMLAGVNAEVDAAIASRAVEAIYRWSHRWEIDDFEGDEEAHAEHNRYVNEFQQDFEDQVENGELVALSAKERAELMEAGATFVEFFEADEY